MFQNGKRLPHFSCVFKGKNGENTSYIARGDTEGESNMTYRRSRCCRPHFYDILTRSPSSSFYQAGNKVLEQLKMWFVIKNRHW